jgi:hypothetical protein
MQNALGYPDNHEQHDDTIFILLDPDQIVMRPFTNDFTNSSEKWRLETGYKLKVEHGSPFSQQYGYGLQWKTKVNPEQVFQGPSPVADMSTEEARNYYVGMGPPYVATGKDMYTIVNTWAEIVPRVHNDYPHLLAGASVELVDGPSSCFTAAARSQLVCLPPCLIVSEMVGPVETDELAPMAVVRETCLM